MDERYATVNGKANVEITPVRKDAPIAPSDDRYVVLERGQYNNLVSNRFGVGVLSICGLVGVVSVATAMVSTNDAIAHAGEVLAKVLEHCGDAAIELIDYLWDGKAESISDGDGWINVRQLRQNWGAHRGYKAESFTALLQKLTELNVGEFKSTDMKEWRLLLVV